jgi:hypothetical protein
MRQYSNPQDAAMVYSPIARRQETMPHILKPKQGKTLEQSYSGIKYANAKGNTECVVFIQQAFPDASGVHTSAWREGKKVTKGDLTIASGTAIATFVDGKFSTFGKGNQHAAVYLGQDEHGIQVLDQWDGKKNGVGPRTLHWNLNPVCLPLSNDGNAFSVIEW